MHSAVFDGCDVLAFLVVFVDDDLEREYDKINEFPLCNVVTNLPHFFHQQNISPSTQRQISHGSTREICKKKSFDDCIIEEKLMTIIAKSDRVD